MIPRHIAEYLETHGVEYHHMVHPTRYTAQETAQVQHISGDELAKTVMVMADGRLVMAVVPATCQVDLERLGRLVRARSVRLAEESEFQDLFAECEMGAMPPLGNLYDREVWIDNALRERSTIAFNAGTHTDLIRMDREEFEQLVHPYNGAFALRTGAGES